MNVILLSYTRLNPALAADSPLHFGWGTPQESLIEFAGRICYRSDDKMGKSPSFISARVREGHEDIIEHVRFVYRVEGVNLDEMILALVNLPTVEYTDLGGGDWIFSLNARNVRDFYSRTQSALAAAMVKLANPVTTTVYQDLVAAMEAGS
ncbi:MAG: FAD-dependent thymidylate synthase [Caldilineales bacterium]|nr:FAD-dependent thymidylate synthase [Caldilineales bacterium]